MEPDRPRREVKYPPKPPRKTSRLNTAKTEEASGDGNESQQPPTPGPSEHLPELGGRLEKKAPVQVVFSHGVTSTSIRSFGRQREMTDDGSIADYSDASATGEMQEKQGVAGNSGKTTKDAIVKKKKKKKKKKEYQDPWDNYVGDRPTTLPLRRPCSGNPDVLDKAEFDQASKYDENAINAASSLGFLPQDPDDKSRMLLFTFPPCLPRPTNAKSKETDDKLKAVEESVKSEKGKDMSLKEFPEGYMGKMLVYRSGAVKLKLGDIQYDVSTGIKCHFPQNVMAVNVEDKRCCRLGDVNEDKAVVAADVDYLLGLKTDRN